MVGIRLISSSPLSALTSPIQLSQIANLTSQPAAQIDPRFKISDPSAGDIELNAIPGLMAITKMLHRLTLCDWDGVVQARTYIHTLYPDVSVSLSLPIGVPNIPTKYAVWGILYVGEFIRRAENVRNYDFTLVFDMQVVGHISFSKVPVVAGARSAQRDSLSPDGIASSKRALDHPLHSDYFQLKPTVPQSNPDPRLSTTNLTVPPSDPDLQEFSTLTITDLEISKWEFFAGVFLNLYVIAHFPYDQPVETFVAKIPGPTGPRSISTGWIIEEQQRVLKYHDPALHMLSLPVNVMKEKEERFFQTLVNMRLGSVHLGRGYIMHLPPNLTPGEGLAML